MKHFIKTHIKAAAAIIGGFILALALCVTLPLTLPRDEKATPNTSTAVTTPEGNWIDFRDTSISENWATSTTVGKTEDTAIEISTAEQLAKLAYEVNSVASTMTYHCYKLTADIDLSAHYWTPIGGKYNAEFVGSFDGQGHSISGMNISVREATYYTGLFGSVKGSSSQTCEIKNLGMVDSEINVESSENVYAGGIVGVADNYATIINCYNIGSTIYVYTSSSSFEDEEDTSGPIYVGGIVGLSNSPITNCYNTGSISGGTSSDIEESYVGGIVGRSYSSITNCYNTGRVYGSSGSVNLSVGGIVGYACGNSSVISNCYNTGSISGASNTFVGGVVGNASGNSSVISNCYNTGLVSGLNRSWVGGIAGSLSSLTITNCYYDSSIESAEVNYPPTKALGSKSGSGTVISNVGKVDGLAAKMKLEDNYNKYSSDDNFGTFSDTDAGSGNAYWAESVTIEEEPIDVKWAFDNVWTFKEDQNDGYPVFFKIEFWIDFAADAYADGSGDGSSEDQAILIETPEQLAKLAYDVNNATSRYDYHICPYYKLTANIDLSGRYWTPIGDHSQCGSDRYYYRNFSGIFDGQGHTITGMNISINGASNVYAGLFGYFNPVFGYVPNAMYGIKNIGMIDSKINVEDSATVYAGGIVGYAESNYNDFSFEITNCYNAGSVTVGPSNSGYVRVGGIVGDVYNSSNSNVKITDCYNIGSVIGSNSNYAYVGGIVGDASNLTIINCYNTVAINEKNYAGGIVGDAYNTTIINCYNTGTINGEYYAGGIAGYASLTTITNCYNTGTINGKFYAGGIVGYAESNYNDFSFEITNCYNTGSISIEYYIYAYGYIYGGGIIGDAYCSTPKSSDFIIMNCYNTGTVNVKSSDSTSFVYAGGIAGRLFSIMATNCYNTGSISVTSNSNQAYAAGIAGAYPSSTITSCYYDFSIENTDVENPSTTALGDKVGTTPVVSNVGKVDGLAAKMKVQDNYNKYSSEQSFGSFTDDDGNPDQPAFWAETDSNDNDVTWDFRRVWAFVDGENDGYPVIDIREYWIDYAAQGYSGGNGSEQSPFEISSAEELALLAKQVNESAGKFEPQHFVLTKDIDLGGKIWTAIGNPEGEQTTSFYGTFDGQNHTIKNLTMTEEVFDGQNVSRALFGNIGSEADLMEQMSDWMDMETGQIKKSFDYAADIPVNIKNEIKNINFVDSYFYLSGNANSTYASVLAGQMFSCRVSNVNTFNTTMIGTCNHIFASGLVSDSMMSIIEDCLVVNSDVRFDEGSGGRYFYGISRAIGLGGGVYNCNAYTKISGTRSSYLAGIAEQCTMSVIKGCTASIVEDCSIYRFGGIVYSGSAAQIEDCYVDVNLNGVDGRSDDVRGGIIASYDGMDKPLDGLVKNVVIRNCFVNLNFNNSSVGGVFGGIVGEIDESDDYKGVAPLLIENCGFVCENLLYTHSGVTGSDYCIGGFIGEAGADVELVTINNCYAILKGSAPNVTDNTYVNAVVGSGSVTATNYYVDLEMTFSGAVEAITDKVYSGTFDPSVWFVDTNFNGGLPSLKSLFWIGQGINDAQKIQQSLSEFTAA